MWRSAQYEGFLLLMVVNLSKPYMQLGPTVAQTVSWARVVSETSPCESCSKYGLWDSFCREYLDVTLSASFHRHYVLIFYTSSTEALSS